MTQLDALERNEAKLKKAWAAKYGLKESKDTRGPPRCVCRLLRKRCSYGIPCEHTVPRADHPSLWLFNRKAVSLVIQPYGECDPVVLGSFCRERKLDACVSVDPAWHCPGHVLFIEITVEGELDRRLALGGWKAKELS